MEAVMMPEAIMVVMMTDDSCDGDEDDENLHRSL